MTLKKPLELILNHEPIIVPTDTVYGLVCRYDSKSAVETIYKLKKRPRRKPLILFGYSWRVLKRFVDLKKTVVRARRSVQYIKQWPGPLTLILPASNKVPKYLNKGFKTIGIRVPNNKFLLKLLKRCPGGVLASTSANISGQSDKEPQKELLKKVKLFIKAKSKEMLFKPSKVIKIKKAKVKILR